MEFVDSSEWDSIKAAFNRASGVFEAELQSAESRQALQADELYSDNGTLYTFRVLRTYKGPERASLVILSDDSSCGASYRVGKTYVVYGYANKDGQFVHKSCARNYNDSANSSDLRFLRGEQPTEQDLLGWRAEWQRNKSLLEDSPASITGRVSMPGGERPGKIRVYVWDFDTRQTTFWLRDAKISVQADGEFRIDKLLPGSYIVTATCQDSAGANLYGGSSMARGAIQVSASGSATNIDLVVERQNAVPVRGKIEINDSPADSTSGLHVVLRPHSEAGADQVQWERTTRVDDDGTFAIAGMPPGDYVLRVVGPDARLLIIRNAVDRRFGVDIEITVPRDAGEAFVKVIGRPSR